MASKQIGQNKFLMQAVAEGARVAIQTMATACTSRQDNAGLNMSGPIMKQPRFNWNAKDKYKELQNFKLDVSNILQNYNLGQTDKVSIIKNWLGREGLQLIATLTQEEQEVFYTLNRKFKPQYNGTIKSLQFCKLIRQSNEYLEKWMGRLRTAAVKHNYKEIDRQLKEQFINGFNG